MPIQPKGSGQCLFPLGGKMLGRDGPGMRMFPSPSSLGARGGKRCRYSAKTAANAFFPFGRGDDWARRPRDEDVYLPLLLGGEGREEMPVQRKDCGQCLFFLRQGRGLGETAQGYLLSLYRQQAANSILQLARLFGVGE